MKNFISIFLSFVLCTLFIISCSNNENAISQVKSSVESCHKVDLEPLNSNNRLDYIGIHHNAALEHAASLVDVTTASDQELFDAIKNYFYQLGGSTEFIESLNSQEVPLLSFDEHDIDTGMTFLEYISKYSDSNSIERNEILNDLQEIVFESQYNSEQGIIEALKEYEQDFMANQSENNQSRYLGSFSILRHSIEYWTEARENECHPWYYVVNQGNVQTRGLTPEFLARLAIDVLHHQDCFFYGGLGAEDIKEAHANCWPGSIYASARAFEPGLGG